VAVVFRLISSMHVPSNGVRRIEVNSKDADGENGAAHADSAVVHTKFSSDELLDGDDLG
jgi:hypothetical protein